MELPPQKGRDPWDAHRACQPGRSGLNSLQSRQQSPHASGNAAADSEAAGQQHGRGVGGEMDGREGETEPKEGGGVWDEACWAVRSSPQHRQRRPQRQSAAASKRQRPARQSSSKRQLAVVAQASAAARQRRRRRRQQRRRQWRPQRHQQQQCQHHRRHFAHPKNTRPFVRSVIQSVSHPQPQLQTS